MSIAALSTPFDDSSPAPHLSTKHCQFFDGANTGDNLPASYYGQHGYPYVTNITQSSTPLNVMSKFNRLFGFIQPQYRQQFLSDFQNYQLQDLELMQSIAASMPADIYASAVQPHSLTTQSYIDFTQPHNLNTSDFTSSHPVRPPSYATDPSSRQSTQSLSQLLQSQRSSMLSSRSSWLPQTPIGIPSERELEQQIWFASYQSHPSDIKTTYHEPTAGSGRRLADIQEIPNSCPGAVPFYPPGKTLVPHEQEFPAQHQHQPPLYDPASQLPPQAIEEYTERVSDQPQQAVPSDDQGYVQHPRVVFNHQPPRQTDERQISELDPVLSHPQRQYSQEEFGVAQSKQNNHIASEEFQPGLSPQFQQGSSGQIPNGHPQLHGQEEYGLHLAVYPEVQPHLNHFQSSELPLMPVALSKTNRDSPPYQWTSSIQGSNDRASTTPLPSETANTQRTHNFRHVKPQEEKPKLKAYLPCPDACGTMQTVSELKKHVIAEHERSLKYHCNHCGWESFRREQWGRHRQKHEKHKRHLNQPCTEACMSKMKSDDPPPRIRRACGVCFKLFDKFETWFDHHVKHFSSEINVHPTITLSGIMKGLLKHPAIKELWRAEMNMHGWSWHGIEWQYQDELFQKVRRALESDSLNGFNWACNDHGPQSLVDLLASYARAQSVTILAPPKSQDEKASTTESFPSAGLAMETVTLMSSPRRLKKAASQILRTKQSLDAMSISEKSDVSMRSASRIPIRSGSTIRKQRPDDIKAAVRSGRSQTLSSNSSL